MLKKLTHNEEMAYAIQNNNLYMLSYKLLKKGVLYSLSTVKFENILIAISNYIFNVSQHISHIFEEFSYGYDYCDQLFNNSKHYLYPQ
jgi:hypothetical protein